MAETPNVTPLPQPQPASTPATPPSAPAATPQIVINLGGGRLTRVVCWLGWLGFAVCSLLLISHSLTLQDYFNTTGDVDEKYFSGDQYGRDKVAIIAVTGTIVDGSFAKQEIDRARKDKHVKAIVLRVVSPGGTIAGSDYIYHHLKKLRDERQLPLVVSMGSIAASGGYYVSMAVGDREKAIYAEPTTTTGSIGVIIPHYDFSGLLQRFDVKEDSLATHPRKQMLSMTKPMTEDHREVLTAYLNEAFTRFKDIVKEGRPAFRKDHAALNQLATGEVFTAPQAKKLGLVDEIGFLEDAVARAIELAGLDKDKTRVVEYRRTAGLLDLSWLGESRAAESQLARLLELNTPQAYYLATTMPALLTQSALGRED